MIGPNAIVVPALSDEARTRTFGDVEQALLQNDFQILPPPGPSLRGPSDYQADMASWARQLINERAERYRSVIERSAALVLVNDMPEIILNKEKEAVCQVPFGVGRFAINLARIATEVYGENRRIFLSHGYPDISELSRAPQLPSVQKARTRQLSLYPFQPISLQGNYSKLAEIISGTEARVARFLIQAGPVKMVTTPRVNRETATVSTPAPHSTLGGENMAKLIALAADLQEGVR